MERINVSEEFRMMQTNCEFKLEFEKNADMRKAYNAVEAAIEALDNKLNKKDYQKTLFNMFDGEDKRITLRCYKGLADVILDRFGNNVMLVPDGKDFFTVSVNVRLSEPFYAWACSFGRRLKVVGPPDVVQKTKEYVQMVCQLYENETGK